MTTDANFFQLFEYTATETPDAACIALDDGTVLSRAWLARQAGRYAAALVAAGCIPGDRVAVQVEKSPHALALYLACLRAGVIFLPANTAYRPAELGYLLADARPRILITHHDPDDALSIVDEPARPEVLDLDQHGHGSLENLAAAAGNPPAVIARRGDDAAALLYTSGTTGRPKGAILSHRAMASCALTLGRAWQFRPDDVLLHALPLFHGHGLFVSCNVALAAGAQLRFLPRFESGAVLEALPGATVFMGVPTFYHRLLGEPGLTPAACRTVRLFTCGSAPLQASDQHAFATRTGHEIVERYGATETMILCSNPLDGERRPGSVGRPLPDVELRIADDADRPLGPDATGMIQVRGPGLFTGYWNLPDATAAEFTADGYFRTGDLGSLSADGYVTITGRAKDLIISGGYNVYPAEVEAAIDELADVRESAVVAVPHPDFGEAVTAFVVPADAAAPPTSAQVVQWCRGRLANYKVPKRVHVIPELPRNTMGKVVKAELRAVAAADATLEATG